MRARIRRLYMGLMTVLNIRKMGFFIPYRYADALPPPDQRLAYGSLLAQFHGCEAAFKSILQDIQGYAEDLRAIGCDLPPEPRWRQDWFPRLDAMAAYTLVRHLKPKRLVEVGSGHSTRFFARAVRDGGLDLAITAIDPAPRADLSNLDISLLQTTVQQAGLAPFADLKSGDMLSIDSSHILMPGSDVDVLFNVVMPSLAPGVMVHIHDMFLPDGYPASWHWRAYNEQLAVATLLQGRGYDVLWSSRYVTTRMAEALKNTPIIQQTVCPDGAFESSLWLRKT